MSDSGEGGGSSFTYYYPEATLGTRMACVMKGTGESARGHKSYASGSLTFSEALGGATSLGNRCTSTIIRLSGAPLYDIRIDAGGRVERKSVSGDYAPLPVCTQSGSE